jgi:Protein of unknown function (DUF2752)
MMRFLQVRPFAHPSQWTSRFVTLGGAMFGLGVAVAWNPIAHPGPKCCLLRMSVGLPCPMCGMTRGVCLCVRGHFLEASWYNPLAVPFVMLVAALCVKWIFEIASNWHVALVLRPAWNKSLWGGLYIAVLSSWVYLLMFRREDDFASTWLGQMLHLFR